MQFILSARQPFNLAAVIRSHGWAQLAPFRRADDALTCVYRFGTGRVDKMRITEAPGGVRVEFDAALTEAEQREAATAVTSMLGLDEDFTRFYTLARSVPKLAKVEARAQGRILRSPTLFEDTVKTILTTNTVWAGTIRMVEALVSQFGDPLPSNPSCHAFPTPQRIAETDAETLRKVTRLGYRAPFVLGLAQRVASGDVDLDGLRHADLPTLELRKRLMALKGVGAYAAANLLMLLGRYDFLTVDSWAMKMVSHEWHGGAPVGPKEVEAAFEHWGEWKGLAYWFWDWDYTMGSAEA